MQTIITIIIVTVYFYVVIVMKEEIVGKCYCLLMHKAIEVFGVSVM